MRDGIRDFVLSFMFFLAAISGMTTACGKAEVPDASERGAEATSGEAGETIAPGLDVEASDGQTEDADDFLVPDDPEDRAAVDGDDEVAADPPS